MNRRRGITLVEMLSIIAVMGMIMSMVAVIWHGFVRAAHETHADAQQIRHLGRFAIRLRDDAHGAVSIDASKAGEGELTWKLPGERTVVYRCAGRSVIREVIKAGTRVHRDRFPLPRAAAGSWRVEGDGRLSTLVVQQMRVGEPTLELARITAATGLAPGSNTTAKGAP